jgi:hypothetical protein
MTPPPPQFITFSTPFQHPFNIISLHFQHHFNGCKFQQICSKSDTNDIYISLVDMLCTHTCTNKIKEYACKSEKIAFLLHFCNKYAASPTQTTYTYHGLICYVNIRERTK